jgi:hypothetical protein
LNKKGESFDIKNEKINLKIFYFFSIFPSFFISKKKIKNGKKLLFSGAAPFFFYSAKKKWGCSAGGVGEKQIKISFDFCFQLETFSFHFFQSNFFVFAFEMKKRTVFFK